MFMYVIVLAVYWLTVIMFGGAPECPQSLERSDKLRVTTNRKQISTPEKATSKFKLNGINHIPFGDGRGQGPDLEVCTRF